MRGADVLVEMLIGYGVDVVFGVPGDTNVAFYEALNDASDRIRHVMARDERSSGFMADAYSRTNDKPGVFECPSGAGLLYALPGAAEAYTSRLPVIMITSDIPLPGEGRGVLTELDCAKMMEPITKASVQVKVAEKIPETIRRAFRVATSGIPGAVHIAIPEDMLHAEIDADRISLHVEDECKTFPSYPMCPAPGKIEALVDLIRNAERPLFVSGGGVNRAKVGLLLTEFAERYGVPIVNSMTGQATIVDDHPLAIGVIGDNGFHPHANLALKEADLVIYAGSKVGSVVTIGGTFPEVNPERKIVHIDIDPEVLANNYETTLSIAADARLLLEQLVEIAPAEPIVDAAWVDHLNAYREDFWQSVKPSLDDASVPLRPEYVVQSLNRRLTGAVNVIADAGTPTPYLTRFLKLGDPASQLIIPRGYGGLGYAVSAVVGAWHADPDKRPIGVFGDGSLGMTAGELESLVRLRVPAILLHFNNGCFGWIKALQRVRGHNRAFSVDFNPLDGKKIAEAFGMKAWRVTEPDAFDAALDQAFKEKGPCLIDIAVESIADRLPPVYSWQKRQGADPLAIG
ncbi:MAG: thiamine pyrophosphate-binding protein [Rhodospirillales bacterium]|jgi:acetolactate synthase-1/2/3 large subunit|nr:thiamine pyrophosphate-binding protein [Rhodospirillales bacterium]